MILKIIPELYFLVLDKENYGILAYRPPREMAKFHFHERIYFYNESKTKSFSPYKKRILPVGEYQLEFRYYNTYKKQDFRILPYNKNKRTTLQPMLHTPNEQTLVPNITINDALSTYVISHAQVYHREVSTSKWFLVTSETELFNTKRYEFFIDAKNYKSKKTEEIVLNNWTNELELTFQLFPQTATIHFPPPPFI